MCEANAKLTFDSESWQANFENDLTKTSYFPTDLLGCRSNFFAGRD